MADGTSGSSEELGRAEPPADGARNAKAVRALRIVLAGLVLLAGLAVAAPARRAVSPADEPACTAGGAAPDAAVIVLPPGHPPIPGAGAHGRILMRLPPGHPPIDERAGRIPAAPLEPVFQPPATVDL